MAHETLSCGDLEAVIGDNAAHGEHRAGYNGVWSLKHRTADRSLFVPGVAGLNHEHIFDGRTNGTQAIFFEPRHAPMSLRRISELEVELHQPPTATFHLESWTHFRMVAPHYIDVTYKCRPHQHAFAFGYIGLFWASYISAPDDKSMYFRGSLGSNGGVGWMQLCTQAHNDESTVVHRADNHKLTFDPAYRDCLYKQLSPMRYDLPFFYGNFGDHQYQVMFDRTSNIRLTHSPSGGGFTSERESSNPAWDFQWLIPQYEVMRDYTMRFRGVLRERTTRRELTAEYERWRTTLS